MCKSPPQRDDMNWDAYPRGVMKSAALVSLFLPVLIFLLLPVSALATRVTTNVYEKSDGSTVEVTTTHSVAGTSINAVWG